MLFFSPTDVRRIEDIIRYEAAEEWVEAPSWHARIMNTLPITGETDTIQFSQPTVSIYRLGPQGADMIYDPMVRKQQKFESFPIGNGLKLYAYQHAGRMNAAADDLASDWGQQTGRVNGYYPTRGCVYLLQNGKSVSKVRAFDGKALFAKDHPVGGASSDTYSNLHSGMPFTAENLARAVAYVATLRHGGDAPRNLHRELIVIVATNFQFRAQQALTAESYRDVLATQNAASNTFKSAYGFQEPIIAPEFSNEPTVWYLGVPVGRRPTETGLTMVQRQPLHINSFSHVDQVTLAQTQELEYHNRGHIGFSAGQPYRIHRFESGGSIDAYMSALTI